MVLVNFVASEESRGDFILSLDSQLVIFCQAQRFMQACSVRDCFISSTIKCDLVAHVFQSGDELFRFGGVNQLVLKPLFVFVEDVRSKLDFMSRCLLGNSSTGVTPCSQSVIFASCFELSEVQVSSRSVPFSW